ncbi:AAA family ATPase [Candidatus Bathyarchaeota archaeon]|nr:MAG: AAA family ATPase [Candidatus Bathyarchaeota archaeon]
MGQKRRMASNDDQLSEFLFGSVRPWWDRQPWLRRVFTIALRSVDKSYSRWSKARVSPRRCRKIRERLDREYPPDKFSPSNLIGRDKEFNLLLDSFRLHVLRHPTLTKYFGREELPKAVCLAGDSGTGKTFLTMVSLREMLLEGYRGGVLVTPVILKGSDVYSEFYGKSTRQLGRFLDYASSVPSVVYIDEFQSFGRKVRGETGAEIEDTRIQDELNRWLDKIVSGKSRTIVVVATNAYEKIREDIRRRLTKVSLNDGVTREMLLAVVQDFLKREGWLNLKADDLLDLMEREVTVRRRASLTPSDIQEIFREVRKSKEAPLREKLRESKGALGLDRPRITASVQDFAIAARNVKLYSEQEKSQEVTDAVYIMKPKVSREDLGGLHDVKNKILNHVALAFNPSMAELGQQSNPRFFLMGPPGTGKTLLAMVAAAENNVGFIKVRGGELMSGANYMGDPEKRVKDLFGLFRQKSPCILLLDEADAIFWGGDPSSNKILAQVKAELSELRPEDRVVVIATSNKEQLIDQATRDRFEPNIYYVHPPLNDAEWNEVVAIHLRRLQQYLHPEIDAAKVTKMFRRQRVLSPRGVSETVSEAHRLWASEIAAAKGVTEAGASELAIRNVTTRFEEDIERLDAALKVYQQEGTTLKRGEVNQDNYRIRLFHFEQAISSLESLEDKEHREIAEALILSQAIPGVTYGLYTSERGSGGILTIQCTLDDSVIQSAQNAVEAVRSWLWSKIRVNLAKYHVHFQIRSILEGAPGAGVSGPSAGYAMLNALISELSNTPITQSKVMTGSIGLKMDVGPVGGLGGRGREAGKLVGILKAEKVKITDLLVPESNHRSAPDEMKMVQDEGISVHPITNAQDGWPILFSMTSEELARKVRGALLDRESLVDIESTSSRVLGQG